MANIVGMLNARCPVILWNTILILLLCRFFYFEGTFEALEGMTFLPQAPLKEMEVRIFKYSCGPVVDCLISQAIRTLCKSITSRRNDNLAFLLLLCELITLSALAHALSNSEQGKIRRPSSGIYISQFQFLKSLLPADEVKHAKVTICPPEWMHVRHRERAYDHSVYANDGELFLRFR